MVKISIFYPNTTGSRFDYDYYVHTHMPMTIEKLSPALQGVTIEQGLSGGLPGSPAPYVASCHLLFDSADAFYEAFAPHAETLQGDIPNYTDIAPVIHISEITLSQP